jgi:tRNA pseudouridine55 synthase
MDGLLNFYKPTGITSAKALYRVRSITRQRKSGHAGTLDPAASGVLVLCLGKATKLVERIMDQPKVYRATARLDVTSESFDSDRALRPVAVKNPPERAAVESACRGFEGVMQQVPPAISAIKIGGVPAYKRQAGGTLATLRARPVTIYSCRILRYDWPVLDFEVRCGRGTYIRALIRDLGARLHTGGCLTALERTAVGPFTVQEAWSLDRLAAAKPDDYLISMDQAAQRLSPQQPPLDRPIPCQPARLPKDPGGLHLPL